VWAAIGVTNNINSDQLNAFATGGQQNVREIKSFQELPTTEQFVANSVAALCGRAGIGKCCYVLTIV